MKRTVVTDYKPTKFERELHINICMNDNEEWVAHLYTNIHKYHNKCIKQGWTQLTEVVHTDGTWIEGTYEAPARAVLISKANKPKRTMSEEQKKAAAERMRNWRKSLNKDSDINEEDTEDDYIDEEDIEVD